MSTPVTELLRSHYKEGFHDDLPIVRAVPKGLKHEVVDYISDVKGEPDWMREFRHRSLDLFLKQGLPDWLPGLRDEIDYNEITYYVSPVEKPQRRWEDVPEEIRRTYDKLGIAKEEQKLLGGLGAQIDSEMAYHNIQESLAKRGVVFLSCDEGLKQYPDLFREYFSKAIPPEDNKFAALNSAFWSGGSFVYIPKGVKCDIPLSVYFRINAEQFGQFERTLIIVDEDAFCHYVEGCSAPIYTTNSLHAAVVEIFVKNRARCRYTTIQNWSTDVYNLVTKRAMLYERAVMEWVDGNLGSKRTVKYPSCYFLGEGGHGEVLSLASADRGMWQDAGAKMVFMAPNCTGRINSKSISGRTGRASYRGLVQVRPEATNCRVQVNCDALILDEQSRSDTYPVMEIKGDLATVEHEASVSNVSEEQLFYLMSRGIKKEDAVSMIVNGFIEPIVKELPMEFAVEINRLINLQMEGSVG
ncbi:MAG: Fe-S cluster assembly protein SufB [Verrucomicrobiae bacterium]|nr:Fe-S cluster assembly protein SufB [Verrucomicrobiae bacterium]MDW8344659.1 Fe-S cluster assembly protein SufB [Verrucomicrobiae bacterium]